MKKTELFEKACLEIKKRDGLQKARFRLKGKDRDKVVRLKPAYSNIASKILYYEDRSNGRIFSWQQITDACVKANLYVTDVVSRSL